MFDENRLYGPRDPELAVLGSYSTLAHWRHYGTGPEFIKLGNRVVYSGTALNEFLRKKTVKPKTQAEAPAMA